MPGSRRRFIVTLAACAAPLFVLAILATSCSHQQLPVSLKMTPAYPAAQILDSIIQQRFQEDNMQVFGVGRVVTMSKEIGGHYGVAQFSPQDPREAGLCYQLDASKRSYVIAFLHCAHVPGFSQDGRGGRISTENGRSHPYLRFLTAGPTNILSKPQTMDSASYVAMSKAAMDALPSLQRGEGEESAAGNWLVVMRPVCVAKDSCLTCHTGAKRGATLGVMVYAVSNTIDKN